MQIIRNYKNIPDQAKNSVLALGNFDGVHLGHLEILKEVLKIAKAENKKTAIMTFSPHPLEFFSKNKKVQLFSFQDKIQFFQDLGIDYLFIVKFNQEFANVTAANFVSDILVKHLKVSSIVMGYDFIFGKNRQGNAEFLKNKSSKHGFGFSQITSYKSSNYNLVYSSTEIRKALEQGDIQKVNNLLGKNYFISNRVIGGDNRGAGLGFRTANLKIDNLHLPKFGVYAVKLCYQNKYYEAVANLGVKPTFAQNKPNLEVHIFNFSEDLYGQKVKVAFIDFIRAEKKFASKEELIAQIKLDCNKAKELLNAA